MQLPSTKLDRSVAANCICLHKEKPFLAVVRLFSQPSALQAHRHMEATFEGFHSQTSSSVKPAQLSMLPLYLQGVGTYAAVHDLLSGSRLHRIDLQVTIVAMCFSPDGTSLVALLRVSRSLLAGSPSPQQH